MSGKLAEHLETCRRICFDTVALIYALESSERTALVAPVLRRIHDGAAEGIASALALAEILVKPLRDNQPELAGQYRQILTRSPGFRLVPVDSHIAQRAAEIRASSLQKLRVPDAVHLATATLHEADVFLTNDEQLRHCKHARIVLVDDFLPRPDAGAGTN